MKTPFTTVLLVAAASTLHAAAPPEKLDPDQLAFFEKKIRPVLAENCYKCHSATAEKVKGSLLLDTKEGMLKGGATGPALVPGKPEKSLLVKFLKSDKDDEKMPPKGDRLSDETIANIEAWIRSGAPDPRVAPIGAKSMLAVDMEKAKKHWAFQTVVAPATPKVKDAKRWAQSPLDKFVLAKLEAKGLEPSPLADKRTLIRRAAYDLTGLPPTPQEVAEFLADKSPNAFAKVVDRLLASPHYGERWGRHWLDVARYADTTGDRVGGARKDNRYPYAWTYRDYVIDAFNTDKPYDRFIIEQIAADRLDLGENKAPLAAMGFLTVGKRFMGNINEVIDDRIDVISQGLMGLTTACARCHDHKFDPIPQRDYYSLHGIFASSVEPDDEPVLRAPANKEAYADFLKKIEEIEASVARVRETEEQKALSQFRIVVEKYLLAAREYAATDGKKAPVVFSRSKGLDGDIFEHWVDSLKKWAKAEHSIFAPWFAFSALKQDEFALKAGPLAAQFADAGKDGKINPLVAKLFADAPAKIEDVAEVYGKLFRETEQAWQSAQKDEAKSLDAPREEARLVLYGKDSPVQLDRKGIQRVVGNKIQNMEAAERGKISDLKMNHPGSPPCAMALADKAKPVDSFVMIRGEPANKGPVAPRQFLQILSGDKREPFKNGSGRLELAKSVASRDNPLTARVLVNRIWQWHFGDAIVRTPGDFGLRSEPPSNPELLDYLATQLMDNGWSLKKLHRLIMLSSAWQQSSRDLARNSKIDPSNAFFWRQNIQRLDFESLRDSLLALGGKNDFDKTGGPSTELAGSGRRTVYGYVDRAKIPDAYRIFDFANPDMTSPQRMLSTVPLQALFMMNSPFVVEQARHIASRSEMQSAGRDEEKVGFLYSLIHQRAPSPAETKLALAYLADQQRKPATGGADINVWRYGFGEYDDAAKSLKSFEALPTFLKDSWVLADKEQLRKAVEARKAEVKKPAVKKEKGPFIPGMAQAFAVALNAVGGQPGDEKHAVIRRWVAPRDGEISIAGKLGHKARTGDGVRGFIFAKNNGGQLGAWAVSGTEAETKVARLTVKKGDTIDFIVTSHRKADDDAFTWAPVIHRLDAKPGELSEWNAQQEFSGPTKEAGKTAVSFSAWERLSQALLETNELIYVN